MKEILNKVTDGLSEKITDSLGETKDFLKNHFDSNLEKLNLLTESAKDKAIEQVNQLISISPSLEEMGYFVENIAFSVGLPISANVTFKKIHEFDKQVYDKIINDPQESAIVKLLVKALMVSDQCQDKIKMGPFKFDCVEISLGLTPTVNLILKNHPRPQN